MAHSAGRRLRRCRSRAIGLLTTALFVTHLAVQLPAGRGADRFGLVESRSPRSPRRSPETPCSSWTPGTRLRSRAAAIVGLGVGGRLRGGPRPRPCGGRRAAMLKGVYGGSTMAGGGPRADDRAVARRTPRAGGAPYWRALPSRSSPSPKLAATGLPRIGHAGAQGASAIPTSFHRHCRQRLRARRHRRKLGRHAPGASGSELDGGGPRRGARPLRRHLTRPFGGLLAGAAPARSGRRRPRLSAPRRAGARLLALAGSFAVSTLGALVSGSSRACLSPLPSRPRQRLARTRPGRRSRSSTPAASSTILVGTPLARGPQFGLPGDGRPRLRRHRCAQRRALLVGQRRRSGSLAG